MIRAARLVCVVAALAALAALAACTTNRGASWIGRNVGVTVDSSAAPPGAR